MRFAWKVTLASLCILVLSIGMGSHLLISISFRSTLNREIAVAQEEMQMLRIAYEAVCDARGITLENLAQQGKSLQRTLQGDAYFTDHQFRVSTRDGEQVYSTLDAGGDRELLEAIDGLSSGYVLRRADPAGRVLIHCAGPVSLPDGMLYMETLRDITSLFADRETHYQVYRWILLIVVGIGAAVMYALSFWLTRPIRALGRAATALAGGDYAARAQVTTGDEIGELAFYFNRMAGAIEQNVRDLEEDMRFKAASYIFSEGKRLEKLSLSLMSLLVVGHSEADVKTVNMPRLCALAAESALPAMEAQGLRLTVSTAEGAIPGDASLLQTLVQNLLDNARKASEAGKGVSLTGEALASGGYRLTVADQGRGIPPDEIGKITEAFYMVDKSRSRAQGGAGLGLALCKAIAALHGGALRFESQEGRGTTVTVELTGVKPEGREDHA